MIDPLRLADALTNLADDYGTKAAQAVGADTRSTYGTASLILYALSIALLESIKPILSGQETDDAS